MPFLCYSAQACAYGVDRLKFNCLRMKSAKVTGCKMLALSLFLVGCLHVYRKCYGRSLTGINGDHIKSAMENQTKCTRVQNVLDRTTIDPNKKEKRFPDAIIIGEMKCGTSAMQFFLRFHPDVAMSKDEANFFSFFNHLGWDWYKKQLPFATKSQVVMEKSVYFGEVGRMALWTPRKIYEYKPDIKMILNLRDPVERTLSEFNMKSLETKYFANSKLENLIYHGKRLNHKHDFIVRGHYYYNMLRWIQYFPLRQIHIVEAETFRRNPLEELVKVEKHLGIRPFFNKDILFLDKQKGFYCLKHDGKLNCLSQHNPPRTVSDKVIKDLKDHFRPDTQKFYELTGRKFNWNL